MFFNALFVFSHQGGDATSVEVGSEGFKLNDLGPVVVNADGTMARITNWHAHNTHARRHANAHAHARLNTHARTHTHTLTHTHRHTHRDTHTQTRHTHTQTRHTHTHTHTHKYLN